MASAHRARLGAAFFIACCGCSGSQSSPSAPSGRSGPTADFSEPLVDGGLGLRAPPGAAASLPPDAAVTAETPSIPAARVLGIDTVAESERVASIAVLPADRGYLLASVTYVDQVLPALRNSPATRPRAAASAPRAATVVVRALDGRGSLKKSPTVVSAKAESVGGVALAPSASDPGEAALAWVGVDGGLGQVFLTRIGRSGEKLGQRMITRSKGGCSDVGVAAIKGGYVAAWLDQRDARAAVYVAKVSRELERIGDEHRIADAKGEASQIRLVADGDQVVLAWSEAREEEGSSGIFSARLGDDLSIRAEPSRAFRASRSASSLQLARFQNGWVYGWVEAAGTEKARAGASRRGVALAWVDAAFRGVGEAMTLSLPLDPSALALDCGNPRAQAASRCHAVISGGEEGQLSFYGFGYRPGDAIEAPTRLASMAGPSTEDTSAVLIEGRLFFAEDDLRGGGRLRVAQLDWR